MALATRQPGADFTLVAHTDQGSQYVSEDYTQQLDDARVLASVGSVGDAYDNAMAESFVDSFKTELIKDRVWHSNTKLELAIVEWVAWFNTRRLHSSIGNRPPAEHEAEWRRLASQPKALSPPVTLFTLNAAGETTPPGSSPSYGVRPSWLTTDRTYKPGSPPNPGHSSLPEQHVRVNAVGPQHERLARELHTAPPPRLPRLVDQILGAVPRLRGVQLGAAHDRGEVILHRHTITGPAGRRRSPRPRPACTRGLPLPGLSGTNSLPTPDSGDWDDPPGKLALLRHRASSGHARDPVEAEGSARTSAWRPRPEHCGSAPTPGGAYAPSAAARSTDGQRVAPRPKRSSAAAGREKHQVADACAYVALIARRSHTSADARLPRARFGSQGATRRGGSQGATGGSHSATGGSQGATRTVSNRY